MKFKLGILASLLAAAATMYFVSIDEYTITALTRVAFKIFLLITFLSFKKVQHKKVFYSFFGLLLLTDVLSYFVTSTASDNLVFIGAVFFICYLILLWDAYQQFKIQDPKNIVAVYYFFVIVINAILVGLHLVNLYGYLEGYMALYVGMVVYNIALYAMIVISLAYYLNSYSRKSMYFLIGSLAFVCSDILVSAYFFYNIRESIVLFHTFLSMLGYVFFFNYFFTEEKPLMIEVEIIKELTERKNAIKD